MKRFTPVLLVAIFSLASLSCMAVNRVLFGEPLTPVPVHPTTEPTFTPSPTATQLPPTLTPTPDSCPNGDCITACVKQLRSLPQVGAGAAPKTAHRYFELDNEYTLVTYAIRGDQIKDPVEASGLPKNLKDFQNDRHGHETIWNYFAAIIPTDRRKFLTDFIVFTDGEENYLASVSQSDASPAEWALSVDIMDATNPRDLTFTLIHEYGHLLTLNPSQVTPSQAVFDHPKSDEIYAREFEACPTYFSGEGCSQPDSYVNRFFDKFWPEIYAEWSEIDSIEDEEAYYDALEAFYEKYAGQFVTDYAPTDPAEDVAETFTFFVLEPKPDGSTIAEEKVLFFYDFPELVQLRSQIGHRLCDQLEK